MPCWPCPALQTTLLAPFGSRMASHLSRLPQGRCHGPHTWPALGDVCPETPWLRVTGLPQATGRWCGGGAATVHAGVHGPVREDTRFLPGACSHGRGQRRAGLPGSAHSPAGMPTTNEGPRLLRRDSQAARTPGSGVHREKGWRKPSYAQPGPLARDSLGGLAPTGLGHCGLRDEGVTEGTS